MRWSEFESSAPRLAALGRERFESTELAMLGTLRKDGWPRVTPIEFAFFEGDLYLGGIWKSKKMRDLERDPRCVLHSVTSDKAATQGDFKLTALATPQEDADVRERYGQHIFDQIGWRPEEPYHLFRVEVREAAFVMFGDKAPETAERLRADASVDARMASADGSNYLVAVWKAR